MSTSIALSPHFEKFIAEQVASGGYNNAADVVRAGLRLLEEQIARAAAQRKELRAAIAVGMASGPGLPADALLFRLEAKVRELTAPQLAKSGAP